MVVVPLGWYTLKNQPHIHLVSRRYLLGISTLKGLLWGVKQLVGYHPKGTTIFPTPNHNQYISIESIERMNG